MNWLKTRSDFFRSNISCERDFQLWNSINLTSFALLWVIAYRINFVAEWHWCSFELNVIAYCIRFIAMNKTWDYIYMKILLIYRFSSFCFIFVLFNYKNLEIALEFTFQSDCVSISLQRKKRCITWIWISEIEHDHLFIQMLICNFRIKQENAIHTWISKIQEISHLFFFVCSFCWYLSKELRT